ncbi:cyclic nucleotide-gated ion channel 1-like isoform X3 [Quercus robur]|uniref:cyclic nucleotide-gated ion channel 1-like isoform X3 n=1 Tax=Quercus robur TaxID=38942 RepID=UPI002163BCB0|nr:cyclic nucleotide-gated ion channel 1-like isoform X3 [Quercus robur]
MVQDMWQTAVRKYFLHLHFLFDISGFLPIPQVVISCILLDMRVMKSLKALRILNFFIFIQYWPRVFQIYLSRKDLGSNEEILGKKLWVRGPVNFFLYIIAGHVLGAFWYCFSIQRTVACWYMACENRGGCVPNSFYCDHNSGYHSFLDDICPKNMPNTELFDFGVYLDAHQSGILESKNIPQKIFYCFCWGMRNLSSFGSNLRTSNDVGENSFALCITIFGLLLFLYFLGNLQMHMQRKTSNLIKDHEEVKKARREKKDDKSSKRRKRQKEQISLWMSRNELPHSMRREINEFIKDIFDKDEDVYLENVIPDLPTDLQNNVKRYICFDLLKKLNIIKENGLTKQRQLLHKICDSLKPVFYKEHCYIVREGDPIDAVYLITHGTAWTCTSSKIEGTGTIASLHAERLEKGQFFGEKLLEWVWLPSSVDMYSLSKVPVSSKTLKTHTNVEAFALMAKDLKDIIDSKLSRLDPEKAQNKAASNSQRIWRHFHPPKEG